MINQIKIALQNLIIQYQYILQRKEIRQSMYGEGECLDNRCNENFFGLFKLELFTNVQINRRL